MAWEPNWEPKSVLNGAGRPRKAPVRASVRAWQHTAVVCQGCEAESDQAVISQVACRGASRAASCPTSSRHWAAGFARSGVAFRTGELALQIGERRDDFRCFERSIPASDCHLT